MKEKLIFSITAVFLFAFVFNAGAEEAKRGLISRIFGRYRAGDAQDKAGTQKSNNKEEQASRPVSGPDKPKEEQKEPAPLTPIEMVGMITQNLEAFGNEIVGRVPGIIIGEKDGKASYKYQEKDGPEVDIDKLDDDKVNELFSKVSSAAAQLRSERMARQIKMMDQIRNINRTQNQMKQNRNVASTPKPYTTPKTYTVPKVYTPPKVYTSTKVYTPPKTPKTSSHK